jgi:replicative DNA helicase
MFKEQIMYRLLAMETNINEIKKWKIISKRLLKLNKIIKIMSKLPLSLMITADLSIQDIRSKNKTIILNKTKLDQS